MKEDDLEFASFMVQNLNVILMTAPELAGVRKGFKDLTSQPSRDLFCVLYRYKKQIVDVFVLTRTDAAHGATTQLRLSRSVYWRKCTHMLAICFSSLANLRSVGILRFIAL